MVTYLADTLVRTYGSSPTSQANTILDNFDVLIAPVLNADGYDYTWTGDRNWRKTMSPNAGNARCFGTDPNRKFPVNLYAFYS